MLVAATQLYERGVRVRDRDAGPIRLGLAPEAPAPVEAVARAVADLARPRLDADGEVSRHDDG